MKVAVFDVCGTLYNSNTTFDFLDNYFSENKKYLFFRKISNIFFIKVLNHYIYKYFKIDLIKIYATSFLKDEKVSDIAKYSQDFVFNTLKEKIKPHILDMLKDYKAKDYKIILMSGSYDFIIEYVKEYVNADAFFASKLTKSSMLLYTGNYKTDILLSKYKLLKMEIPSISKLIVVSDNKTDLELMLSADEAFAICNKRKHCNFWKKIRNHKITILEDYV